MSRTARITALLGAAVLIAIAIRAWQTHVKSRPEDRASETQAAGKSRLTAENALRCYFPLPTSLEPAEELRPRPDTSSALDLARELMNELHRGPESPGRMRLFPEGTSLTAAFLGKDGTLYLDYPGQVFDSALGPREEFLFLRCLARAMLRNCPEVKALVLLVDGQTRRRLFMHLPAHGRYVLPEQ